MLVATLMLALAGGGLYAAWMYRPEFRSFAQPQIDRIVTLVGMALPPTQTPKAAKTSATTAPAATAPQPAVNSNQASSTMPPSAAADLSADAASPSAVTDTAATAVGTSEPEVNKSGATAPGQQSVLDSKPLESKQIDSKKVNSKQADSKQSLAKSEVTESVEAVSANAIILSSQGAQKRLVRSVAPKYPVEATSRAVQGTIVLKTFVGSDGNVSGVRLVEGNPALAPAAVEAVKQWSYRPYMRDGKAYPFQTVVILDFQRP
jgi:TonB family protein